MHKYIIHPVASHCLTMTTPTTQLHSHCTGTEIKLADTCRVDIKELCLDLSLDMLQYIDNKATEGDLHGYGSGRCDSDGNYFSLQGPSLPALESDTPAALVPLPSPAEQAVAIPDVEEVEEATRTNLLFPNAFKIAGLKHVSDNVLSAVLHSLPQLPGSIGSQVNLFFFWG